MGQDLRELRRRCESRLRALALPDPFDLEEFCQSLANLRGRSLYVRSATSGLGPYGLWIATASADYILYAEDTSPLHRLHIILHELSHILWNHHPVPLDDLSIPEGLFSNLRPETVLRLLQRAVYSTDEEREAEMLATLLLARVTPDESEAIASDDPDEREVSRRLVRSLEQEGSTER